MTTTTAVRPFAEVLRQRWTDSANEAGQHPNKIGSGNDIVEDALQQLVDELVNRYRVFETSKYDLDGTLIGAPWLEGLEGAAFAAGQAAWSEHVLPAVVAIVEEHVRRAPEWVALHPENQQLRADLADLEAGR